MKWPVLFESGMLRGLVLQLVAALSLFSASLNALETEDKGPVQQDSSVPSTPDTLAAYREKLEEVNLSKASEKVGFGGILYSRGGFHRYLEVPPYLWADAARNSLDANYTMKVGVNANAFMKIWSMLSFGYDFGGHFLNDKSNLHPWKPLPDIDPNYVDTANGDMNRAPYLQDKNREGARVFEDLAAGVDLRTEPMDATVRAGSVLWMEGSPFTIWKRDPRPKLAWYYEGYEPEQSSEQYYTQKFFYRRNDLGRLSWPKKAFGGMELDAYRLPWGLGLQFDFAQPSNLLPTKTDGNTYNLSGDAEALGSINSLGELYYGRLTKKNAFRDLTGGFNLLWVSLPRDIINQRIFSNTTDPNLVSQGFVYQFKDSTQPPFYAQPRVFSLDARGNLSSKLFLHADVALAYEDSVKYLRYDDPATPALDTIYDGRSGTETVRGGFSPAAYVKLNSSGSMPMETEIFYAAKNFWSPYAMTEYAVPVHYDEMKLGAGAFNYQTNLVGIRWKASPKVSFGFLSFTIGQHVQAEKGKDMLRFQHNLNGRDVWSSTTSWARTEPGRLLDEGIPYGNPKYQARLGEGQRDNNVLHLHAQPGGLRGDDLELWEEFAAYDDTAQANAGIVPRTRKYATSLALDVGYNLAPLVGYSRPWMISFYGGIHSIAKDLTGPANTQNTLLWSGLARLESVISLGRSFQIIGLLGMETWKSEKAYRNTLANLQGRNPQLPFYHPVVVNGDTILYNNILYYVPILSQDRNAENYSFNPYVISEPAPIDYLQYAGGLGFDWDFADRAGLHVRFKYATHQDKTLPANDWSGSFLFAETKIWF